jgi:hypothetical protein
MTSLLPDDPSASGADRAAIRLRHRGDDSIELRDGVDEYLALSWRSVGDADQGLVVPSFEGARVYESWGSRTSSDGHVRTDLVRLAGENLHPSSFADDASFDDPIRDAFERGQIVLLRLPPEALPQGEDWSEPELLPTPPRRPPPPDSMFKFPVTVLDDTGTPVQGARLKFDLDGTPRITTTNAAGDGSTEWVASTPGKVRVLDLPLLRTKLKPRWKASAPSSAPTSARQALDADPVDFDVACGAPTTIVIARPGPAVRRVRMVGMLFDADKCFLLPSALPGIRSIVTMQGSHPDDDMVVVGHAESDEVCNGTPIALDRAKALIAYLTNDPDPWLAWFAPSVDLRKRWGTRELQLMLSAVSGDGGPFFSGYASGVTDRATLSAIRSFQSSAGLVVDGKPGPKTRKALVTQYMALEGTTLPDGAKLTAHGCAGHPDDTLADDGLQPDDRRMEVFFFEDQLTPPPAGDVSSPGSPEYDEWRSRLVETVDFESHGIHVQVLDVTKKPVPFASVTLKGKASQNGTSDANGFVSFFGLTAGDYTLQAACKGYQIGTSTITYPTAKTVSGVRP